MISWERQPQLRHTMIEDALSSLKFELMHKMAVMLNGRELPGPFHYGASFETPLG